MQAVWAAREAYSGPPSTQVSPPRHPELAEQGRNVDRHRLGTNEQRLRDVTVGRATRDEAKDFALPRSETIFDRLGCDVETSSQADIGHQGCQRRRTQLLGDRCGMT